MGTHKKKLSLPSLQFFKQLVSHGHKTATVASATSFSLTYHELLQESTRVSTTLGNSNSTSTNNTTSPSPPPSSFRPIALLAPRDHNYVVGMQAILQAGGAFVPLHTRNPPAETEYILRDVGCEQILVHPHYRGGLEATFKGLKDRLEVVELQVEEGVRRKGEEKKKEEEVEEVDIEWVEVDKEKVDAMVVYTSGTTGRPKGVVKSHAHMEHMIQSVVEAWQYTPTDRILHLLPLHHLHGILNKLLCVMWTGGVVEILVEVKAQAILERLAATDAHDEGAFSLFMAVPTIYALLVEELEADRLDATTKAKALQHVQRMRLMVSGSAALPHTLFTKWENLSGHRLLERYGTTETAMTLTNPYRPVLERHPGFVGQPFPGIEVKLVDQDTGKDVTRQHKQPGEVYARRKAGWGADAGDQNSCRLFSRYHNRPTETKASFDESGYYKTGDVGEWDKEKQSFRILGRASADILKSGGYKISALEIEAAIMHAMGEDRVAEAVVLGREHPRWGDEIVAVVRLKKNQLTLTLEEMQLALAPHLTSYKLPRALVVVEAIPKNALGKVVKKTLLKDLGVEEDCL